MVTAGHREADKVRWAGYIAIFELFGYISVSVMYVQ